MLNFRSRFQLVCAWLVPGITTDSRSHSSRFQLVLCMVRSRHHHRFFAWLVPGIIPDSRSTQREVSTGFVHGSFPASPQILVAHLAPFELRKGAKLVSQKKIVRGLRVIPPQQGGGTSS